MNSKKYGKYLKIIVPPLLSLFIILIIWGGYVLFFKNKAKSFLQKIDTSSYAEITYEAIYGIHLNLKGTFSIPENVSNLNLILTDGKNEIAINTEQKINDNTLSFTTSDYINKGINLEFLPTGTYYLILKGNETINNQSTTKYYSVQNKTNYGNLEYYTLTKNNQNNLIKIEWNTYEECPTLRFKIEETTLPDDVCDITIDPGHGGHDVGSQGKLNNKTYNESDLNLNVSLKLRDILKDMGYKVAMVREDDSDVNIYEAGGSAVKANETKSKFNFAIHHNSFAYQVDYLKGLEVYVANDTDFTLANLLVKHIINEASTTNSPKETYMVGKGIYQRFFTLQEIAEDTVQPSNKTTNMIYYYNIRELGGISTGATNDGRYADKEYPKNPYYDSNNTTEPYLLELGYMNNAKDLENIINHPNEYAKGIANALKEYLEKDQ